MKKAEIENLVESIIRIRDRHKDEFMRFESDQLADAANLIYHNADKLAEDGVTS